jgi:hypothetical protein
MSQVEHALKRRIVVRHLSVVIALMRSLGVLKYLGETIQDTRRAEIFFFHVDRQAFNTLASVDTLFSETSILVG